MARIVTVYEDSRRAFVPTDMSYVRWHKISAALAALGHEVDIATREPGMLALARSPERRPAGACGSAGCRSRASASSATTW